MKSTQLVKWGILILMTIGIICPTFSILIHAIYDLDYNFIGFDAFDKALNHKTLLLTFNSFLVSTTSAAIVCVCAFVLTYGITHTNMRWKKIVAWIMVMPIMMTPVMPAISSIYLFGNQGLLIWLTGPLYGFTGIVLGEVVYTLPYVALLYHVAMLGAPKSQYQCYRSLGATEWQVFRDMSLPLLKPSLIAGFFMAFALIFTDFGIPKLIGGNFPVLPLEMYKLVIGQSDFIQGSVYGIMLLIPGLLSAWFQLNHHTKIHFQDNARIPNITSNHVDRLFELASISILMLPGIILGVAIWASMIELWPYNFSISFKSYQLVNTGWGVIWNSVEMAVLAATVGIGMGYVGTWLVYRLPSTVATHRFYFVLTYLPAVVPGLVLGLGYILFFNDPLNPLSPLYGSVIIMALSCIMHYASSTILNCFVQVHTIAPGTEMAYRALGASDWQVLKDVSISARWPHIVYQWWVLFNLSLITASALTFIYAPENLTAAVAIYNLEDSGAIGEAAALAVLLFTISLVVNVVLHVSVQYLLKRKYESA